MHSYTNKRSYQTILLSLAVLLSFQVISVKSQDLEIITENRRYYILFPDGKKVEIVKEHEGGALNAASLSPDAKYVLYTDCNWLGFESSGKDLFYCRPDGTERTFIHKISGDVSHVNWIMQNDHYYVLFLEVWGGAGKAFIGLIDFDNRMMILKIDGWVLEPTEKKECFIIGRHSSKPSEWSTLCLDSLLSLSDPAKYNIEVFEGYAHPNLLFLSTRREAFLNPESYSWDIPNEREAKTYYGGLGYCFNSPYKIRRVFCLNTDSESWMGVLNKNTNKLQFQDSSTTYKYGDNFIWSSDAAYLGFVKRHLANTQEIVVLEFLGDSSYAVKESMRLDEEQEIELIGWSTRENGFYYMIGKKEFLKLRE